MLQEACLATTQIASNSVEAVGCRPTDIFWPCALIQIYATVKRLEISVSIDTNTFISTMCALIDFWATGNICGRSYNICAQGVPATMDQVGRKIAGSYCFTHSFSGCPLAGKTLFAVVITETTFLTGTTLMVSGVAGSMTTAVIHLKPKCFRISWENVPWEHGSIQALFSACQSTLTIRVEKTDAPALWARMLWIASSLTAIVFFIPESCGHGPKLCAVVAPTHQTAGTVLIVVTISLPLSTLVEVALVAAVLPAPAVHVQAGQSIHLHLRVGKF